MESLLDGLVYRNLFDTTELALDLVNINIRDKDKRLRVRDSFLVISRRQKNRVINGLLEIPKDKRMEFVVGCFVENVDKLKHRIMTIEELSKDTRIVACEEIDKLNSEKIKQVKEMWTRRGLDILTEAQWISEIKNWKMFH